MVFENRRDAGRRLAAELDDYQGTNSLVLAVPRGGVVVGYEVAEALDLPLDVVVPRKIGAPDEPELAIGAVAAWGNHEVIIDPASVRYLRVSEDYIKKETRAQMDEIDRRLRSYRGTVEPPQVENRTAILVDDGIATGLTIEAAIRSLRRLNPAKIVLAVPVAASEAVYRLSRLVDEVHVLSTPTPFLAVGHWYAEFEQTTDEEVIDLLRRGRQPVSGEM